MNVTAGATLGYAAFDLETGLRCLSEQGFSRVEITELGSYCRHLPYREVSAEKVQTLLSRYQLRPVALNISVSRMVDGEIFRPSMAVAEESADIEVRMRWYLELASDLSIPVVSFPMGPRLLDESRWPATAARACEVMHRICAYGAQRGVGVNVEVPHLYLIADTTEHALWILDRLSGIGLGATVDTSHWGIAGYDLAAFVAALGDRLRHIHLRDSVGADTRDFRQELELTPGEGTVDFQHFADVIDTSGYRGEVTLELEHRTRDIPLIEDCFARGIAHLAELGYHFGGRK